MIAKRYELVLAVNSSIVLVGMGKCGHYKANATPKLRLFSRSTLGESMLRGEDY